MDLIVTFVDLHGVLWFYKGGSWLMMIRKHYWLCYSVNV